MKRLFPQRKRARAIAKVRTGDRVSMDWIAFALAVWLAVLVGAQLVARLPDVAQQDSGYPPLAPHAQLAAR